MPFLELFDAPDACEPTRRTVSVVPQQALALTNNELARSLSRELASGSGTSAGDKARGQARLRPARREPRPPGWTALRPRSSTRPSSRS